MPDYQAADSVIREEGADTEQNAVNADPRKEWASEKADTSTPIAPQNTVKDNEGDAADDYTDPRSEQGRSF